MLKTDVDEQTEVLLLFEASNAVCDDDGSWQSASVLQTQAVAALRIRPYFARNSVETLRSL
jgi:hypothetical protein